VTGAPENLQAGSQVGQYILEARLGGGSFGAVWRARHTSSGQLVAIKLLTGILSSRDRAGLRAEVELLAATASSRSPHVVRVLDGGIDPIPYVVMEYIQGTDLAALLRECGKLPLQESIEVGLAVADALCALNQAGIIHRDVKPANVMLDQKGTIKLADFGIAKIVGYETITMAGQLPMTMAYAAPEVWEGSASHQSDLYALGILLFQCLTGTPPFVGNYAALYRQHTSTPPDLDVLSPDTPPSLRELVRLCLEKDPDARPKDAACLQLLHQAEEELAEAAVPPALTEPTRFGPWLRQEPHPTQPWAWHCVHEATGEEATVEVHFAPDLAYGVQLHNAIAANVKLVPLGAERLLGTSRLLLRPGEGWRDPPAGEFSFWLAREELPPVAPPAAVTAARLGQAVQGLLALIDATAAAGLPLSLATERVALLADGSVHVQRPGLPPAGDTPPMEQALAFLRGLPLDEEAQGLVAAAQDLRDLHSRLAAPAAAPAEAPPPLELGVAHPADGTSLTSPEAEDTGIFSSPPTMAPTPPEAAAVLPEAPGVEAAELPHTPIPGVGAGAPPRKRFARLAAQISSIPPRLPLRAFAAVAGWWRRRRFRFLIGLSSIAAGGAALGVTAAILLAGGGSPAPPPTQSPSPLPSRELAYVGADGNLWISDADGADPQALTSHGRGAHPAWSPDATEIAYVYVNGDLADAGAIMAGQVATEIRILDVETREERPVLGPIKYQDADVERFALLRSPEWEDSGKAILYHEQRGGADTGRIRRHPLEFADGSAVDSTDRYDGTVVQSSFLPDASAAVSGFALMPRQQGIFFEVGQGTSGVYAGQCWIGAIPGASATDLSTAVVRADGQQCHGLPAIDPQGGQLGFYSYPGGGQSLVRVRNLETDEEWDIGPAYPQAVAEYLFWPKVAWSGDGQYVAYESWDEEAGQEEIFIQAASSGEPRKLASGRHPAWARPEQSSCSGYECLLPPRPEAGQPAPYVFWVAAPTEATSGEPFNVIVLAKNVGDAGGNGGIDTGAPQAPQVAPGPQDETFPPATVVDVGAELSVFTPDDMCGAITKEPAKYPANYVFGSGNRRWEAGDEHFLGTTITPGEPGGLSLNIRATIGAIMDSRTCMFSYPGESPKRDQQNMPVIEWLVKVR
jgi:serine/threonine-protein kinase